MKINKTSIASMVKAKNKKFANVDVEGAISTIFEEISAALTAGDRVEIRGFGSMVVRKREGKVVRNPKTNEKVRVGDKGSLYFRPSKQLISEIND